jgi:hypothetical protein
VHHGPGGLQHPVDPPRADDAARHLAEQPADGAHREGDDGEEVGDLHHGAWGDLPVGHPLGTDEQHSQHADRRQRLDDGVEHPPQTPDAGVDVAQLVGHRGESSGLLGLAAERLDDERTVERLVGDRRHLSPQRLRPGRQRRMRRW